MEFQEKLMAMGFLCVTVGYIVLIRFFMGEVQEAINKIKVDDKREYTLERAANVLLKRINALFIPSIILIYYAFFVTYTAMGDNSEGFNVQRFLDPGGKNDGDETGTLWTLIGGFFIIFSISILLITNMVIVFVKGILFTETFVASLMYVIEIIKYLLVLGLIGGAVSRMTMVSSLLNTKGAGAFTPALVKYLTAAVFYIPCMLTNAIADASETKRNTPKHVIIVFIIQCLLIGFNVILPMIDRFLSKHLVNTIIKGPIYLSNEYNYSDTDIKFVDITGCVKEHIDDNYDCVVELMWKENVTDKIQQDNIDLYFPGKTRREIAEARGVLSDDLTEYKEKARYDYNYAYSFWFYINASPDDKKDDMLMIDFAKNPEVKYNSVKNQLKIEYNNNKDVTLNNIQLQKWNHLVLNYTSGRLDVFLNGDLAVAKQGISINKTEQMESILSGQYDGINGRIANVVYYHKPLSKILIDHLYDTGKGKNVPSGGGIFSTLMTTSFNAGEAKTMESISDGISTGLTKVLPSPEYLEETYKYFENLPHNLYIDTWHLIDTYIFMFDTTIDNKENALADKYKKTTDLT